MSSLKTLYEQYLVSKQKYEDKVYEIFDQIPNLKKEDGAVLEIKQLKLLVGKTDISKIKINEKDLIRLFSKYSGCPYIDKGTETDPDDNKEYDIKKSFYGIYQSK